jgi:Asp-tRNA(Asn)/Glu-tRNA(Gln) amidotransferase A subunit family amidase
VSDLLKPISLTALAADLRSGALQIKDYVEQVCDRIDSIDPVVQAFLPEPDRRERLIRQAKALERRFPDPSGRPPLFGVPVGVKDVFRTEGLPTTAGSRLPSDLFDGPEAASVSALRGAGALVAGKTVTTEFAFFEPGQTRNPHNPEHTPGGSSSGSAAAVAAGLCPLALGTQTIGSTIRPTAFCGIAGFKPSFDRIDTAGVIFIAPSLDHVGLLAQDVAGLALAASTLCRKWLPHQPAGQPVLGIPEGAYLEQASPEALAAFSTQVAQLESAGYQVRRVAMFENILEIATRHVDLMAVEMAEVHRIWFERYEPLYRLRTAAFLRQGQAVDRATQTMARADQVETRQHIHHAMRSAGINLWISPSAVGPAPQGLTSTGDPAMSLPWTFAGLPTVGVPAGESVEGMPLGMQLID